MPGALQGLRVLDLTNERGVYCTKVMADLGADVIRVEEPRGGGIRDFAPFYHEQRDPNRSLYFWHYNTSKRSVTLDITSQRSREALLKLVDSADVLVESFDPGYMASIGLGYPDLSRRTPKLIYTSITPFGQDGPLAKNPANDIVLCALGGMMNVNGDPDLPPLAAFGEQSYHVASNYGVASTLAANQYRRRSGKGQHIDVSTEACIAGFIEHVGYFYWYNNMIAMRQGSLHWSLAFAVVRCKDGYSMVSIAHNWEDHLAWMLSDGFGEELAGQPARPTQIPEYSVRRANAQRRTAVVEQWASTKGVDEFAREGQERRLPFGKVLNVDEVFVNPQLRHRGFFIEVEHPELSETVTYPGAPFVMHASPYAIHRRPPLLGEHTHEVLAGELGISEEELAQLEQENVV
jgi:crotonobetainyl-CoA:carnitine CoA-transferase CaiB-like acyl-CoA transferase